MKREHLIGAALVILPTALWAADADVSYLIARADLKQAVAGTQLTFALYGDSGCTTNVATQVVNVEDVQLIEQVNAVVPKDAPKVPESARLLTTLTGIEPPATSYLTVTGTGITPIGMPCQLQFASTAGLALPFSGSTSVSGSIAFSVTNTGGGSVPVGIYSESDNGIGVDAVGNEAIRGTSSTPQGLGMRAFTTADDGIGALGLNIAQGSNADVPYDAARGSGVFGFSKHGPQGVFGEADVSGGSGVHGIANTGSLAFGVWGESEQGDGVVGNAYGAGVGVNGYTLSGTAVLAFNDTSGAHASLATPTSALSLQAGASTSLISGTGPAGDVFSVSRDGLVDAAGGLRSVGDNFPANLSVGQPAGSRNNAARLGANTTLAGTVISNSGGGPAMQVATPSGSGGIGIQIFTDGDAIRASGRIVTDAGFHGPCQIPNCNSDIAEGFDTVVPTEPGDVVALAYSEGEPTVHKTMGPYEGALVGVVSTSPGLVFDHGMTRLAGDNTHLITRRTTVVGLLGRVPVKVSMENGPVSVGDPLTSSSTPGVAMKANRAGMILGYALEGADGEAKILAWIRPGPYVPTTLLERLNDRVESLRSLGCPTSWRHGEM
jgi:hypothetical protein